jgi:hypothetical protein
VVTLQLGAWARILFAIDTATKVATFPMAAWLRIITKVAVAACRGRVSFTCVSNPLWPDAKEEEKKRSGRPGGPSQGDHCKNPVKGYRKIQ